jgi:Vacuolar protein sorting-associated protein 62
MATPSELLQRHRPFLKYDSHETYFADSAAEWTDNPGNRLTTGGGQTLATAGQGLSLSYLGTAYPGGRAATNSDYIGDPSDNYVAQARALHAEPGYANRMYGHAVTDRTGVLWLQYWFFYFYNDYNLIGPFIKAGLHEGDWEMIQIRLAGEVPDYAVYAQHKAGEGRDWRQVDVLPGTQRPIVYPARGSHASYFEPGLQWTGVWFDNADGKRRSPEITLEVIDTAQPAFAWALWPGHWGGTKAGEDPLDSDSPVGPGAHAQWDDPLRLEGAARADVIAAAPEGPPPVPPTPPRVTAEWHGATIRVNYTTFATGDRWPIGLVVTINSPDEPLPPTTERFEIAAHAGSVDLTVPVEPAHAYDIFVSVATPDGLASESVRVDLPAKQAG